jgi:hypothetical protein
MQIFRKRYFSSDKGYFFISLGFLKAAAIRNIPKIIGVNRYGS